MVYSSFCPRFAEPANNEKDSQCPYGPKIVINYREEEKEQ
jgi:hypothetical protein